MRTVASSVKNNNQGHNKAKPSKPLNPRLNNKRIAIMP